MDEYPHGFLRLLDDAPLVPVMYTGGLENYPDLIDAIARERPISGNGGDVLRLVRDPFLVAEWLRDAGFPVLEVFREPSDVRCLRKPLRGSAGFGIAFDDGRHRAGCYYQRYVEGVSFSALFDGERLIGVTEQLVDGFRYVGTIAPWAVPVRTPSVSEAGFFDVHDPQCNPASLTLGVAIGELLVERSGMRGWWGFDGVFADGVPYLVEVNPRYTAAMEILDRVPSDPLAPALRGEGWGEGRFGNLDAYEKDRRPLTPALSPQSRGEGADQHFLFHGKRILFADRTFHFPADGPWYAPDQSTYADIPMPGTLIETGQPILTVFASGETSDEVRRQLHTFRLPFDS